jgi:hypothetical protein
MGFGDALDAREMSFPLRFTFRRLARSAYVRTLVDGKCECSGSSGRTRALLVASHGYDGMVPMSGSHIGRNMHHLATHSSIPGTHFCYSFDALDVKFQGEWHAHA